MTFHNSEMWCGTTFWSKKGLHVSAFFIKIVLWKLYTCKLYKLDIGQVNFHKICLSRGKTFIQYESSSSLLIGIVQKYEMYQIIKVFKTFIPVRTGIHTVNWVVVLKTPQHRVGTCTSSWTYYKASYLFKVLNVWSIAWTQSIRFVPGQFTNS